MFGFRPRRTVNTRPAPCLEDIRTASAWGMNLDQWQGMTDFERSECRRLVVTAPRFQS